MATLSDGTTTLDVSVLSTSRLSYPGRTIVHAPIGRPDPDVTIRPAGVRVGTLELRVTSRTAGLDVSDLHLSGEVLTLSDPSAADMSLSYVLSASGEVSYPDRVDEDDWRVQVSGVQEVLT